MQHRLFAAACAALLLSLPARAANNVETFAGAARTTGGSTTAQYQDALKKYYSQALAARVPSNATRSPFEAPEDVLPRKGTAGSGDYLKDMVTDDGITDRWAGTAPIKVFIGRGATGYREKFQTLFAAALTEWSKASGGRITFVRVLNPEKANIIVNWEAGSTSTPEESGDTHTRFGTGEDGLRYITSARISLLPMHGSISYSDEEMHKICLHEIGHALGLRHSTNSVDIMFFQSNPGQISALGPRDASTIKRLYSPVN